MINISYNLDWTIISSFSLKVYLYDLNISYFIFSFVTLCSHYLMIPNLFWVVSIWFNYHLFACYLLAWMLFKLSLLVPWFIYVCVIYLFSLFGISLLQPLYLPMLSIYRFTLGFLCIIFMHTNCIYKSSLIKWLCAHNLLFNSLWHMKSP